MPDQSCRLLPVLRLQRRARLPRGSPLFSAPEPLQSRARLSSSSAPAVLMLTTVSQFSGRSCRSPAADDAVSASFGARQPASTASSSVQNQCSPVDVSICVRPYHGLSGVWYTRSPVSMLMFPLMRQCSGTGDRVGVGVTVALNAVVVPAMGVAVGAGVSSRATGAVAVTVGVGEGVRDATGED